VFENLLQDTNPFFHGENGMVTFAFMEYLKLFEQLQQHDIRYMLCGGLAVNVYGIPRMTADIDIVLDFEEKM